MIDRAIEEKVVAALAAALLPRDGVKIVGAYEAAEAGEVKGEENPEDGVVVAVAVGAPAWDRYLVPSCSVPVALALTVRREVTPIANLLIELQRDATAVDRLLSCDEFTADGVRVDGGTPPRFARATNVWTIERTFVVRGVLNN